MLEVLALLLPLAQSPVLSEVMADNRSTLEDEDGDQSDWFELFNPAAFDVDLGGWTVSDDAKLPTKWTFPSGTLLGAGQALVVFASDKDRAIAGEELHTNFKLKDEGEYLGLFAPGGVLVHEYSPAFGANLPDSSYGLAFDASGPTAQEVWFAPPSPGAPNGLGGPRVEYLDHQPQAPLSGDAVVVTAAVTAAPGTTLQRVYLRYRVDFEDRVKVDLADDGSGADAVAGDGIFTGVIPGGIAAPGHLLRWYVVGEDTRGGESQNPSYPDPDNSPRFHGTLITDPTIQSPMDVYHWFVEHPTLADRPQGTRASLVLNGELYDNVFVRTRGSSSAGWPKHSYKFDFNRGYHCRWDPAQRRVEELNLNSTYSDKAFLRQFLAFSLYQESGATASTARMVRLHQNGEFFSVCVFIEQPDEDLLIREGLEPTGALYKMFNTFTSAYGGIEKKTRLDEDNSDLDEVVQGVKLDGKALERFLFDHLDVPAVVSYLAATVVIFDNDHVAKNYYAYRETEGDGEWRLLPWDKDLTLGRNFTTNGGVLNDEMFADKDPYCHPLFGDRDHPKNDGPWNALIDACYRVPRIRAMTMRRLRTLMDEILERKTLPFDQRKLETRLEQYYQLYLPDISLDQQKWGIPSWGTKQLDFRGALDQLENGYLNPRRTHLFQTHGPDGFGTVPGEQSATHLRFGAIERDPASGDQDEEYVEIVARDLETVDLSGWRLVGGIDFTFPAGAAVEAGGSIYVSPNVRKFRSRASAPTGGQGLFVVGPSQGHLATDEDVFLVDPSGVLVATSGPATMTVRDLRAGSRARLAVVGLPQGEHAFFLASLFGGGPTDTPYGVMDLSFPLLYLGVIAADEADTAELPIDLPPNSSGIDLWLQTFLLDELRFTNSFAATIE